MDYAKEIREAIIAIAASNGMKQILFNAKVLSVGEQTCTVEYNDIELTDVRLSAVIDSSTTKVIKKPVKGSYVLVCDLSGGELRDLAIVKLSETELIQYNGGKNGGIPKIQELKESIDSIKSFVEAMHKALPSAFNAIGAGTAALGKTGGSAYTTAMLAKKITIKDFEDTKITH